MAAWLERNPHTVPLEFVATGVATMISPGRDDVTKVIYLTNGGSYFLSSTEFLAGDVLHFIGGGGTISAGGAVTISSPTGRVLKPLLGEACTLINGGGNVWYF
jgi:hypothetical protein